MIIMSVKQGKVKGQGDFGGKVKGQDEKSVVKILDPGRECKYRVNGSDASLYNIAIIAQFRCAPREVKISPFRFLILILILKDRKNILKMNKEVGMLLPKIELIQVE